MLKPTLDVDVARAEMFRPRSVVVPDDEISRAEIDVVANVVGDAVAMQKLPPIALNVYAGSVDVADESASCGAVEDEMFNNHRGVVVPMPTFHKK